MKEFFRKIMLKLKGLFTRKPNNPEGIINQYQKVVIQPGWSSAEKINYTLKNYAKDFRNTEDFSPFSMKLWELSESNERPLLVMIMGEFKTGKSTFINAILGKEVLKSDVTPATAVVTMIAYGEKEKLVAHFHNQESTEYPIDMLDKLTAEGDESKQALRSSIKYVELQMPLELLRKITLIDTPGLNVDNELHIQATKQFMHEADMVLWVFAYGKTASRTELAAISELGERLKPIAILNRIDEIDEEEETLEDVLGEIKLRLKTSVKDVYGVSSFLANKGMKEGNQVLLGESGWSHFSKMFDHQIVDQADTLKISSLANKAKELVTSLSEFIQGLRKDLDYLHTKYNNKEQFEGEIKETISLIEKGIGKISNLIDNKGFTDQKYLKYLVEADKAIDAYDSYYLTGLIKLEKTILKLSESEKILENIRIFKQVCGNTRNEMQMLEREMNRYMSESDHHAAELEKFEGEVNKYNHSGIFGGRPLIDWQGFGAELEKKQNRINENAARLNSWQADIKNKLESKLSKVARQNKEHLHYLSSLVKMMEKDLSRYKEDLATLNKDYSENMKQLNKRYEDLAGAQKFVDYIIDNLLDESVKSVAL